MSDLESRLAEVLRSESASAPEATGLADAARTRARARRRTRLAAVGGVGVAVVLVTVGISAFDLTDDPEPPVPSTDTASDAAPVSSGRWETWHGVTVFVPEDWEYGDQATWCADGGSVETFRVTRPGGISPAIGCSPAFSYGLSFQEIEMEDTDEPFDWPVVTQTGEAWPPGTFVGGHGENGVLVTVAGPDHDTVADVLATVQAYGGSDPHGCSPRAEDDLSVVSEGAMSVCRYDVTGELEQSELLDGADAAEAAAALDSTLQGDLDCEPSPGPGATIRMFDGDRDVSIELDGACTVVEGRPDGIADADVLYWALSPGWTGDATGLPLPDELRTLLGTSAGR